MTETIAIKLETEIPIPMRDGKVLYADLYKPDLDKNILSHISQFRGFFCFLSVSILCFRVFTCLVKSFSTLGLS